MWKYLRGDSDEDVETHKKKADELLKEIQKLKEQPDNKNEAELTAFEPRLKHIKSRTKAYVFGPEKRNVELDKINKRIEILKSPTKHATEIQVVTPIDRTFRNQLFRNTEKQKLIETLLTLVRNKFLKGSTDKYFTEAFPDFVKDTFQTSQSIQAYIDFLNKTDTKTQDDITENFYSVGTSKFKLPKEPIVEVPKIIEPSTRTCYDLTKKQILSINQAFKTVPLTEGGTKKRNKHAARRSAHGRSRRGPTPRRARSRRSAALRRRASRRAPVR